MYKSPFENKAYCKAVVDDLLKKGIVRKLNPIEIKIEELKMEIDSAFTSHLETVVEDIKYEVLDDYGHCEDPVLLNQVLEDIDQVNVSLDITYKHY